jgi:RecB family endonuclease NucS
LSFSESDIEEVLARHPELLEDGLTLVGRQVSVGKLRVDLLYRDRLGDILVVELKKGVIKREHVGQIMDYAGSLYDGKPVRLMLLSNRVPPSFQRSLEYHGIEWREISEEQLRPFLD